MRKNLGFIPNSILVMQRKPKMAKAFAQMTASIWDLDGKVDRGLKRLIAHVASRTAGCQYCMPYRRRRTAFWRRGSQAFGDLGLSDQPTVQRS
jgi:alkylhydroperoxidase family enzyme